MSVPRRAIDHRRCYESERVLLRRRPLPPGVRGALPGAVLWVAFVVLTLLSLRPLMKVDRLLNYAFDKAWPALDPFMAVLAKFGQRGILLPLLCGLAIFLARRRRTWQPVILTLVSLLTANFVVGVVKLATARDKPVTGDPKFFEQGMLYPSGHAANAILYFGLAALLVRTYHKANSVWVRVLVALTWFACSASMVSLLYRQLHWFTDIVGGLLVGGAVLRSTAYDRGLVRRLSEFAERVLERIRQAWRSRRGSKAQAPAAGAHAAEPVSPVTTPVNGDPKPLSNGSAAVVRPPVPPPGPRVNGAAPDPRPARRAVPDRQHGE